VIINESPGEIVSAEGDSKTNAVVIPIALSVVLIIILGICIRQLKSKSEKDQL
jgi:hypothetical protein